MNKYHRYAIKNKITTLFLLAATIAGIVFAVIKPEVQSNQFAWGILLSTSWLAPLFTFFLSAHLQAELENRRHKS